MSASDRLPEPPSCTDEPPCCTCEHCLVWQSVLAAVRAIGEAVVSGEGYDSVISSVTPSVRDILQSYGIIEPDHGPPMH